MSTEIIFPTFEELASQRKLAKIKRTLLYDSRIIRLTELLYDARDGSEDEMYRFVIGHRGFFSELLDEPNLVPSFIYMAIYNVLYDYHSE